MKNQKGFTLIEMMIVLLVISVLLLVTIPNIAKHSSTVNTKGCEAYEKMLQAQVQAYKIDHNAYPSNISDLTGATPPYIHSDNSCPEGTTFTISSDGEVTKATTP